MACFKCQAALAARGRGVSGIAAAGVECGGFSRPEVDAVADSMWNDKAENTRPWLLGLGALIAAAVVGFLVWRHYSTHEETAVVTPVARPAPPPPETAPPIANPVPAQPQAAALPPLNDSDQLLRDSIAGVIGNAPVEQYLVPQNIVRHIVATVDNLARHKLAVELRPIKPTPGQAVTTSQGDVVALSEANFARYSGIVRVVQSVDVKALAVVYQRLYPLFQESYEDLGYPGKYFNDRLVEVIDNLLAAPEVPAPIPVVQPKVFYEFADPNLEARSAGQKLLIRMGPANARIIKAQLRAFRAQIAKGR
jgi:hypothetical protein